MGGREFGVDFGTSMIKICKKEDGIVLQERNVIAVTEKNKLVAVGNEAFEMYEKVPESIQVCYPIQHGVIANIVRMQLLWDAFLKKIGKKTKNATFVIAVPADITEVEKKAFYDLIQGSAEKIKSVSMIEKPIADALGLGLDVTNAKGAMIVNLGADTTEISIMSLGGMVLSKLIPIGGNQFDDAIQAVVKKEHHLLIGKKTAEQIKKKMASALKTESESMHVYGRDVVTGLPVEVDVSSEQICACMLEHLETIIESIKAILERTPPEISSDILCTGIYLTGGTANIRNIREYIQEAIQLKVNICSQVENTVVLGLGKILCEEQFRILVKTWK